MNRDHLSGAHALKFLTNLESDSIRPPVVAKPTAVQPPTIAEAFFVLGAAVGSDHGYAWSWHSNLAMAMQDEGVEHEKANRSAARFMSILFSVDTAQFEEFKAFEPVWAAPAIDWPAVAECSDKPKTDADGWIALAPGEAPPERLRGVKLLFRWADDEKQTGPHTWSSDALAFKADFAPRATFYRVVPA